MDFNKLNKKMLFVVVFGVLALIALNINVAKLVGSDNQFFTLYQMLAPTAGMFLGPVFGGISVLFAELVNFAVVGKEVTLLNFFRILPMIFAAVYFGSKKKYFGIAVPIIAAAVFVAHPIGREVWFYTLLWTVPILAKIIPENLFARSLGATFTAHAVGGAYWIWLTNMPAHVWVGLIPVAIFERIVMASGIAVTYLVLNTVLDKLKDKIPEKAVRINPVYILSKKFFVFKQ